MVYRAFLYSILQKASSRTGASELPANSIEMGTIPIRLNSWSVFMIIQRTTHLYKISNAVAMIQLRVLGKSEQALSGDQMTTKIPMLLYNQFCAQDPFSWSTPNL